MFQDFYSYYTLNKVRFIERELIDNESKKLLDDIDSLTDKWSSEKGEDFWFEMDKYQCEWNVLREKAKVALAKLNKDNFTVDVKHENKLDNEGNIISQRTSIGLKEK